MLDPACTATPPAEPKVLSPLDINKPPDDDCDDEPLDKDTVPLDPIIEALPRPMAPPEADRDVVAPDLICTDPPFVAEPSPPDNVISPPASPSPLVIVTSPAL
jgi:hypothetical protein